MSLPRARSAGTATGFSGRERLTVDNPAQDILVPIYEKHPAIRQFLADLNRWAGKYPALALSPSLEVTLAVAAANLRTPGWHLIVLPARSLDLRVELERAALQAAHERQLPLVVLDRSISPFRDALKLEPEAAAAVVQWHARGVEDIPDLAKLDRDFLCLIDLDRLEPHTSLAAVERAVGPTASCVVLFTSRPDHRLIQGLLAKRSCTLFGLHEEQLAKVEELPERESTLFEPWGWVAPDARKLPPSLGDIRLEDWMQNQWKGSPALRHAARRGLAAGLARRELLRQRKVRRSAREVTEARVEAALGEAARAIDLLKDQELPGYEADLLATAKDLFYSLRSLCVPAGKYDTFASRTGGAAPFAQRSKLLTQTAARTQRAQDAFVALALSIEEARALLHQFNPKSEAIADEVRAAYASNEPLVIVVSDETERQALEDWIGGHVKLADGSLTVPASRQRLAKRDIRAVRADDLRTVQMDGGRVLLAKLPPYSLAREAFVRGSAETVALIYPQERKRYSIILGRERAVQQMVFSSQRQADALDAIGVAQERIRATFLDPLPSTADAEVAEATAREAPRIVDFDSSEFFEETDPLERSGVRALTEQLELEDEAGSSGGRGILPDTLIEGVRVRFRDGTTVCCRPGTSFELAEDSEGEARWKPAHRLEPGDLVLIAGRDASRSSIILIGQRLMARTPRAAQVLRLNSAWRQAILDHRHANGLTWHALREECHEKHGYGNITGWSIYAYARAWVWLPNNKKDLAAILRTVDANDLGKRADEIWTATLRLRKMSTKLRQYLRDLYKAARQEDEVTDIVLDAEWDIRGSDFEDLFDVKEVASVEHEATFEARDYGRLQRG